jgi:hypothetical protein
VTDFSFAFATPHFKAEEKRYRATALQNGYRLLSGKTLFEDWCPQIQRRLKHLAG